MLEMMLKPLVYKERLRFVTLGKVTFYDNIITEPLLFIYIILYIRLITMMYQNATFWILLLILIIVSTENLKPFSPFLGKNVLLK